MTLRLAFALLLSLFASVAFAQWQLLPGLATDIGVGARGDAWVIGIERVEGGNAIYRWTGSDWQIVPGGAVRIDVGPDGTPWVINSEHQIFRLRGGGWERLPGLARDIGVGPNGSAWVVGITPTAGGFTIHRWNGSNWDVVPGGAVRIDVGARGEPWVVNDRGEIFQLTSANQWQLIASPATSVTIANNGTVWALGTDRVPGGHSVQHQDARGWRRVEGGAVALSAGAAPWLINSENQIFRWDGAKKSERLRNINERR